MTGSVIPSEVPSVGTPILDGRGYINPVWHEFFFTLLRRTGGTEGLVPVTEVTAVDPLQSTGGTQPELSILAATPSQTGSMSAADKAKLDTVTAGAAVSEVQAAAPITSTGGTTPIIGIDAATPATAGSMSAADKSKLDGITAGAAVSSVGGTAPIVSSGGSTPNISINAATTLAAGSMSAADKSKLDGIGAGATVISVGGTAPIVSSGGATPNISINAATGVAAGSMSAADKAKLDLLVYATGTWTPTMTFATPGNLAVTYNLRQGTYTQIGRKVCLDFVIGTASFTHTTAAGEFRISGLPGLAANAAIAEFTGALSWEGISIVGYMAINLALSPSNPTYLTLVASGDNKPRGSLVAGNMPSGNAYVLIGHIEYFV